MAVIVSPAPDLNAKFDPRTGNTGDWLGADGCATIQIDATRVVWLFNDTFWRTSGSGVPTDRLNAEFINDSLGIQTGLDLATASVSFIRKPGGGPWFPVSSTHYAWPEGAIVLDGDMYVLSKRVDKTDYTLDEGWTVHKIPNILSVDPQLWQPVLLYESAATPCRPDLSLYEGGGDSLPGTGYVYAHGIWLQHGWRFARWTRADFVAGNFGNVTWNQGLSWISDYTQSAEQANSFISADGSVHRRTDGRYVMLEVGATYPQGVLQARVAEINGGVYYPGASYYPIDPILQVGDRVADNLDNNNSGVVVDIPDSSTRTIQHDDIYGGGTFTRTLAQITRLTGTNRATYVPPEITLKPDCSTYAGKAHPELSGTGLVCTYIDNRPNDDVNGDHIPGGLSYDLSTYWPKFVRIMPPVIHSVVVSNNTASWTIEGDPDRLEISVAGGAWTELADPSAQSTTISIPAGISQISLRATGIGGVATDDATVAHVSKIVLINGEPRRLAP